MTTPARAPPPQPRPGAGGLCSCGRLPLAPERHAEESTLSPRRVPVVVLGAGLTGLSAAFHLRARGIECRLIERGKEPGGHAVTQFEQGYGFDRTGHLLHLRDPSIRSLALQWIKGGTLEIERQSRVFSHGVYTRYPFQANTFGLPKDVAFRCVRDFITAHFAPEKPPPKDFEEFCRIHFGDAISDTFMVPYNTKLWGVPPKDISADWCSRFVPLPKLDDVLAGAVGLNDRELGYNTRFTYPRRGIGQLTAGLAEAVGPIELDRAPIAIDRASRTVHLPGESIPYETLISTLPLPNLIQLLTDVPAHVQAASSKLRCTHLYYLDVALNGPCCQPLHWVYVPEPQFPFYRVGCYSHFSSFLAPPNKASLYVELADRSPPDLPTLLPLIAKDLKTMGITDSDHAIRFARVRKIEHAYVIFDKSHAEALATLLPFLRTHRIQTMGRYGGWNYSSMEDALLFGRDAATTAAEFLDPSSGARGAENAFVPPSP